MSYCAHITILLFHKSLLGVSNHLWASILKGMKTWGTKMLVRLIVEGQPY